MVVGAEVEVVMVVIALLVEEEEEEEVIVVVVAEVEEEGRYCTISYLDCILLITVAS